MLKWFQWHIIIIIILFTSLQMFALYKDPEGQKVFDRTMPASAADGGRSSSVEKPSDNTTTL